MRAVFLERYGPPEVLTEHQVPPPQVGTDLVRIHVLAAGVNFADLLQRLGLYGSAPKLPYVPGFEVSGEVIDVGAGVRDFAAGDRVVAIARSGGYAEQICVPSSSVQCLPANLTYEQGAALPVNYLTAWFCLFEMGHLQAGERVLIHSGAGGVGTAAIQLAKEKSVEIFATVGSDEKVVFIRALGVDHPINYHTADFREVVRQNTQGDGADLILDSVGGKTLRRSYEILAPLGRLISYGLSAAVPAKKRSPMGMFRAWWTTPRFSPLEMIGRNAGVFGFHLAWLGSRQEAARGAFRTVLGKAERGILVPVIAGRFPLSARGAVQAHHFLHERRNIGKVILLAG